MIKGSRKLYINDELITERAGDFFEETDFVNDDEKKLSLRVTFYDTDRDNTDLILKSAKFFESNSINKIDIKDMEDEVIYTTNLYSQLERISNSYCEDDTEMVLSVIFAVKISELAKRGV